MFLRLHVLDRVVDVPVVMQRQTPQKETTKKIGIRVMGNVAAALTAVMNTTAVSCADEQTLMTQSSRSESDDVGELPASQIQWYVSFLRRVSFHCGSKFRDIVAFMVESGVSAEVSAVEQLAETAAVEEHEVGLESAEPAER